MQAADKTWRKQHCTGVMDVGISQVGCYRTSSVLGLDALEVVRYQIKGFVPSNAFPTVGCAANWMLQPVFVVINVLEGNSLRADVTTAKRVFMVSPDVEASVTVNTDLDSADRFAQIAGAIVSGRFRVGFHG